MTDIVKREVGLSTFKEQAQEFINSNVLPKHIKSVEDAIVIIAQGGPLPLFI